MAYLTNADHQADRRCDVRCGVKTLLVAATATRRRRGLVTLCCALLANRCDNISRGIMVSAASLLADAARVERVEWP